MHLSPIDQSFLLFLAIFLAAVATSALIITKGIDSDTRVKLRPITQPSLTVVGMMFSILLGFFIANALRDYSGAIQNAHREANALGNIFRLSNCVDSEDRNRLHSLARQYADVVINEEWPAMNEGKSSNRGNEVNQKLWEAVLSIMPADERQSIACNNIVRTMEDLGEFRRARHASACRAGMPLHLWCYVSIGAAAIVAMTFMFAPENKAFHAGIICCMMSPLMVNVYLLLETSHPFSGAISVHPDMLELIQSRLLDQPDVAPSSLPGTPAQ